MTGRADVTCARATLEHAAAYALRFRDMSQPVTPRGDSDDLRRAFCVPMSDDPRDPRAVIDELIAAVEPGLVGNTQANFFAWVMGGSAPTGVAADWLTSVWGQNAAIFQTSPAAAVAEEAVAAWLLDLLDLPRECSVGFVTGATMAGFVCLAAARTEVLRLVGHDFEAEGLYGAPKIHVFLSDDAHVSNMAALRYLGFGDSALIRVPSDAQGLMQVERLQESIAGVSGPKIIISQAGHINSGGMEPFARIADLAGAQGAWHHVDGAFGLWARVLPEMQDLMHGSEAADSWSVDGHKWLQIPYDSGFAIVRNSDAHRRAMAMSAAYLNRDEGDGRNPSEFNPELSRRARGFAAWAVLRELGRNGVRDMIRGHCSLAAALAQSLGTLPGVRVLNDVRLNQVAVALDGIAPGARAQAIHRLSALLNEEFGQFVRPTIWKGQPVLRISIISPATTRTEVMRLAEAIGSAWSRASLAACADDQSPA
jgi:glutamate/tyrosine decarboxylase-like PLP-dependent enzyme